MRGAMFKDEGEKGDEDCNYEEDSESDEDVDSSEWEP